jgi:hypothetical protein
MSPPEVSDAGRLEVLVNGGRVGVEEMPKSSVSRFFDVEYAVPAELVRGQEKVTVRLQALGDSEVAPVFGVRVIRAATDALSSEF